MDKIICPRCNRVSLEPGNRLVTEKCGHIKCRECFINDLEGCHECLHGSSQPAQDRELMESQSIQSLPKPDVLLQLEHESRELCISSPIGESASVHCASTFPEVPKTDSALLSEATVGINATHNCSSSDESQEAPDDSAESLKILEEYILPPKSKIEKFFRETKTVTVFQERIKPIPDHVVKIVENGATHYKCNICEKKFTSRSQQYYHAHCANGGSKRYKCKVCAKDFFSSSHLNYHIKSNHEAGKYQCNLCPKTFKHIMNLRRHKRTHDGVYKYKCKECGLGFRETKTFTAHINKHRNIFPFVCKVCGKKFSFKSNLTQHQKIHTGLGKNFRCDECGREFLRKNSFMEHMNRHNKVKSFQCKLCQALFIDRKTLERHMNTHGSKYYKCPSCDVKCGRKDNLVRHIRNMHPNEDLTEIMKNVKTVILANKVNSKSNRNKAQELNATQTLTQPTTNNEEFVGIQKIPVENSAQISVNTSVIRSIGNVKPVQIPTDCQLEDNLLQKHLIELEANIQANNHALVSNCNVSNNTSQTAHASQDVKKPRKKYDPCEIYRKILSGNDVDDSVLESEELFPDSRDDHFGCCDPISDLIPNAPLAVTSPNETVIEERRINDNIEPLNFGEIHWRKRTSQNFYTSL